MNWVEIGSCDYDTILDSPYYSENGWGVIVEPVTEYIRKLKQLPNVQYINAAVTSDTAGVADFHIIKNPTAHNIPDWVRSCGTIKPQHATLKHFGYDVHSETISVNCISLQQLYNYKPLQIQYESKLMTPQQDVELREKLRSHGYTVTYGDKVDYSGVPYNSYAVLDL